MKSLILILPLLFASPLGAQEFYKWKDAKGQWHFSDTRPAGAAEKVSFNDAPMEVLPRALPCAAFAPGDTRAALGYGLGSDAPIQIEDVQLKRLDGTAGGGQYSWKLVLQNSSDREVVARAVLKLVDCGESAIAEETLAPQTLAPLEARTVNGTKWIGGPEADRVARFLIQMGAPK